MARPSPRLRGLEEHPSAFLPLAGQRDLGRAAEQWGDEPDYEWLMIDASHIKVHPHATGARGGNQDMGVTKGGSTARYIWPWMRMVCRSEYVLQRVPQRIAQRLLR